MTAGPHRLGIDFGTSHTVAALAGPDGRVRSLLFDGTPLLPSAVFAGPGTGLLVGADAVRAAVGSPDGFEENPKRRIDDGTVWLGEREYPVVDLVAAVLRRVRAEAERVHGGPVAEVVLTHPAAWGRPRTTVLLHAATAAGLGEVRLVPEPVAAAASFATALGHRIAPEKTIVVYDLGAGTFDVSVLRPSPGGFEVVASDGLADVGGLDLDAAVVDHARTLTASAADAWQRLDWPQTPADQQARQTLWHAARALKEQLSRHASGDLHVPLVDQRVRLTREEFEKAARAQLERTAGLTLTVLRAAGVPPEQIGGVFLVGGSSRIPLAATLLHQRLRIAPTVIDQPEQVVAEGALLSGVRADAPGTVTPPAPWQPVAAPSAPVPAPPAAVVPAPPPAVVPAPPPAPVSVPPPAPLPAPQPVAALPAAGTPQVAPAVPAPALPGVGSSAVRRQYLVPAVLFVVALLVLGVAIGVYVTTAGTAKPAAASTPTAASTPAAGAPAAASTTAAPTTQAPAITQAAAPSAFPAAWSGTWSGTYLQSDGKSYQVVVAVTGGTTTAQVRYPDIPCLGTLTFLSATGAAVHAEESILTGHCTPTGTMTIALTGGDQLDVGYVPDIATYTAHAVLTRG